MITNYLQVLEESLIKKVNVLKQIENENKVQEKGLDAESFSLEEFEAAVDRKDVLITELRRLDQGFEQLYERIKEQLLKEKENYQPQIARLQLLISQTTDLSVLIQAQEMRNKRLVEGFFSNNRNSVGKGRKSSKAAYDYYKSMSNAAVVPPQYMDKKK